MGSATLSTQKAPPLQLAPLQEQHIASARGAAKATIVTIAAITPAEIAARLICMSPLPCCCAAWPPVCAADVAAGTRQIALAAIGLGVRGRLSQTFIV